MKRSRLSVIILSFLLINLFGFLFVGDAFGGVNDLNFTFENDNLYNSTNPSYYRSFNVENPEVYSGNYPATYSFEDEIEGTEGADIEFIDNMDVINSNTSVLISSNFNGHDKILNVTDNNIIGYIQLRDNFDSVVSDGIIEFWFLASNDTTSDGMVFRIYEGATILCDFIFNSDDLRTYNPTSTYIHENFLIVNQWFYFEIEFDDSVNTFDFYTNGMLEGSNIAYKNPSVIGMDSIAFGTGTNDLLYYYLDGIGYSWDDNYNSGNNIVPLSEVDYSTQQVNAWEFDFEAFDDLTDVGDDSVNGWTDVDDGNDMVNAINYYTNNSRQIEIEGHALYDDIYGIERDFNVETNILNVSWDLFLNYLNDLDCNFSVKVLSNDDTEVIEFDLAVESTDSYVYLYYYNGTGLTKLGGVLSEFELYNFNLFVDYSSDTWVLRVSIDGIFDASYFGSLSTTGKTGLGKISFLSDTSADATYGQKFWVDKIGVYTNGISQSDEFAYMYMKGDVDYWNVREYNLFSFYGAGNLSFRIIYSATDYVPENPHFVVVASLTDYTPNNHLINVYDVVHLYQFTFSYMKLFVVLYNSIQFTNISMDGVKMLEGTNEYYPTLSHDNVNSNESYFYVGSNNRLQFTLTVDDNDTEYIQASFNINNIPSENRSVSFRSDINGQSKGFLFVDFNDATSTSLEFPYHASKTSAILVQTKVIDELTIIITDNDLDDNDFCSGYIYEIELIYNPDLAITITTLTLLAVIVPLIVMIVPSVAMKKKFGVMGVMATFVLMAVICVLTSLIPVWLFSVIILGLIGFLVTKKKMEGFP